MLHAWAGFAGRKPSCWVGVKGSRAGLLQGVNVSTKVTWCTVGKWWFAQQQFDKVTPIQC